MTDGIEVIDLGPEFNLEMELLRLSHERWIKYKGYTSGEVMMRKLLTELNVSMPSLTP